MCLCAPLTSFWWGGGYCRLCFVGNVCGVRLLRVDDRKPGRMRAFLHLVPAGVHALAAPTNDAAAADATDEGDKAAGDAAAAADAAVCGATAAGAAVTIRSV